VLSYNGPGLEQLAAYNLYTSGTNFPSEVKYFREQVYVAVRGEDCIVVFDVKGGKLEERGSFKVGEWPRHFEISVHGEVFVSCQRGNLVQKFQITPKSIIPISQMKIVTPSCVVIL
jgi:6-phosphogluconolactonase (cycloisomerase 2 family)